jgi:hypothetical protein
MLLFQRGFVAPSILDRKEGKKMPAADAVMIPGARTNEREYTRCRPAIPRHHAPQQRGRGAETRVGRNERTTRKRGEIRRINHRSNADLFVPRHAGRMAQLYISKNKIG